MTVKVGETAPDFTLTSQAGSSVSLKDFRGQKNVIVYFYPKDDSPGCTTQACAFRDSYEVFKDAGAEVVGITMIRSSITRNSPPNISKLKLVGCVIPF